MKYNKEISFHGILIFIIILLIIILLIYFIYLNFSKFIKYDIESFTSENMDQINIQSGISKKNHSGRIIFKKPFQDNPKVFTQMISTPDTINNVYSIQIYNIKPTGFSYTKNYVSNLTLNNDNIQDAVAPKLDIDDSSTFTWTAIGKLDSSCNSEEELEENLEEE